jgi:hypothetical protein
MGGFILLVLVIVGYMLPGGCVLQLGTMKDSWYAST